MKQTDFRKQINLMTSEEFNRFLTLMRIDPTRLHSLYLNGQKEAASDIIAIGYYKLRNNEESLKRFDSKVIDALYEATFG